jgi:formate dehydrogenase iron-sulfur subunit
MDAPRALLIDLKRCIGCRACVAECKKAHGLPGDDSATTLSAISLTALQDVSEDLHVRKLCMHCKNPSCASVCPVGALEKTAAGPVTYDARVCLGCRYCMVACPWSVPRYEWNAAVPSVRKCDMCVERAAEGKPPACVEACPVEATVAGTREELLKEAHRRIAEDPEGYVHHVYGETEAGGTCVLFLSPVPFDTLGFPDDLPGEPLPSLTWRALEKIPGVVTLGGTALFGIWWITHRREEVAAATRAGHGKEGEHDER